jgi:hypothetical protein
MQQTSGDQAMILHASFAADDPQKAAETVADLMGGFALPMSGNGGAWMALAGDKDGTLIEVLGRGREYHRQPDTHCRMVWGEARRHGPFHMMIETPHDEDRVRAIAAARGCQAHRARHAVFDVLEFWIDDCVLLDVVTPEMAAAYRSVLQAARLPTAA